VNYDTVVIEHSSFDGNSAGTLGDWTGNDQWTLDREADTEGNQPRQQVARTVLRALEAYLDNHPDFDFRDGDKLDIAVNEG